MGKLNDACWRTWYCDDSEGVGRCCCQSTSEAKQVATLKALTAGLAVAVVVRLDVDVLDVDVFGIVHSLLVFDAGALRLNHFGVRAGVLGPTRVGCAR